MPKAPAKATTEPGPEHRIVLLVGRETFLQIEYTDRLREKLRAAHGGVDTTRFDGASVSPAVVLDECRTFGLMQQHKLVIVDFSDQFVKEDRRPIVERYAQSPAEQATLVLRAEKWNKGKLDAMIEKVGAIVPCDSPTAAQAARWCLKRSEKQHGATINEDAARLLVERLGPGLSRLDAELAKLALGIPEGSPKIITTEAVAAMVGRSREEEAWAVQSSLLRSDPQLAVKAVRDSIDVAGNSPMAVSYFCVDLARKLHGVSQGLAARVDRRAISKAYRLWGEGEFLVFAAAERTTPHAASELFKEAVRTDHLAKLGGDPDRLLERLALRFASV
jgi:DNA polymerase III delta subunit